MTFFNVQGVEIDVKLPRNLDEAEAMLAENGRRLSKVLAELEIAKAENASLSVRKNISQKVLETSIERQAIRAWKKNTSAQIERRLADLEVPNAARLQTPEGMIEGLIMLIERARRTGNFSFSKLNEKEKVVFDVAQRHYRNSVASSLSLEDIVLAQVHESDARLKEHNQRKKQEAEENRRLTQEAMNLISRRKASSTSSDKSTARIKSQEAK